MSGWLEHGFSPRGESLPTPKDSTLDKSRSFAERAAGLAQSYARGTDGGSWRKEVLRTPLAPLKCCVPLHEGTRTNVRKTRFSQRRSMPRPTPEKREGPMQDQTPIERADQSCGFVRNAAYARGETG